MTSAWHAQEWARDGPTTEISRFKSRVDESLSRDLLYSCGQAEGERAGADGGAQMFTEV